MGNKHVITATLYDKAGSVLAKATNNYTKSHPMQAKFAQQVGQPDRIFLHAELAALVKLKRNDRPVRVVVERYMRNGQPANAKPCPVCEAALKHWGVSKVEYTL